MEFNAGPSPCFLDPFVSFLSFVVKKLLPFENLGAIAYNTVRCATSNARRDK